MRIEPTDTEEDEEPETIEATEAVSKVLGISRSQQDAWALRSHLKAEAARSDRRFVGEIVPLRANPEEARDQSAIEPDMADLERLTPFMRPGGTLTPGNTSAMHDGSAIVVVVSDKVWQELGRPKALRLVGSAAQGVSPENDAVAPIEAMKKLYSRLEGFNPKDIGIVELSETSAAQALAFSTSLGLNDDILNPDGGAVRAGPAVWRVGSAAGGPVVLAHGAAEGRQRPPARSGDAGCARRYGIGRIIRGRVAVPSDQNGRKSANCGQH